MGCPTTFNPPISIEAPGEGLMMRPLSLGDFHRGFLPLLSQLTTVGVVAEEQWQQRFNRMLSMQGTYLVTVIEDTNSGQVVGSATLVVEDKFIHDCGRVGRVEDVVVAKEVRGRQLGKLLLATDSAGKEAGLLQGHPQLCRPHGQVLQRIRVPLRGRRCQLHGTSTMTSTQHYLTIHHD